MKIDKSSKEAKLINDLEAIQQEFSGKTLFLSRQDQEAPATRGELNEALYSVSEALSKLETAFDNYFCEK